MNKIEMRDVVYRYNKSNTDVLKNINIEVEKGKIFGLLGPSGAGKTTIIKLLTGQLDNKEQQVLIDGENIRSLGKTYYKNIGMVMDTAGLYDRLNCMENLLIFAIIHGIPTSVISDVLKEVGLYDSRKLEVYKLSSGMRQRLLLARAILHSPQILFLDEPTKGLDPNTMEEMHKLILKKKEEGTTIFLTTHNMVEAEKLCDTIALLNKGRIVETGRPELVKQKYMKESMVQVTLKDGSIHQCNLDEVNDENLLSEWIKDHKIKVIHSLEPTLEEVFISLTEQRNVKECGCDE